MGMLLHRLMTLGHIVSSTKLHLFKRKGFTSDEYLNRHGVEVVCLSGYIFELLNALIHR